VADVYLREEEKGSDTEDEDVELEKEEKAKAKLKKYLSWNEKAVMFICLGGLFIFFICKYKCFPQPDQMIPDAPEDGAVKKFTKKVIFGPASTGKERLKVTKDEDKLSRKYLKCKMDDPELQSY